MTAPVSIPTLALAIGRILNNQPANGACVATAAAEAVAAVLPRAELPAAVVAFLVEEHADKLDGAEVHHTPSTRDHLFTLARRIEVMLAEAGHLDVAERLIRNTAVLAERLDEEGVA